MRKHLLVLATVLVALGAMSLPAWGQTKMKPDLGSLKTSLDVDQAEARTVIRLLLKGTKASFVIAPDIKGAVTAKLEDVTVEQALKEVLRQVGASYRYENGVYRIAKAAPPKGEVESEPGLITMMVTEMDIREVLRSVFKTAGANYAISPDLEGTVTLAVTDIKFETLLQMVLKQIDGTYRVEGGVYLVSKQRG